MGKCLSAQVAKQHAQHDPKGVYNVSCFYTHFTKCVKEYTLFLFVTSLGMG